MERRGTSRSCPSGPRRQARRRSMELPLKQVVKKRCRARRSSHVEQNGIAVRFDRQTEAKKPAALPLGIDHLDDRAQQLGTRVEAQTIAAIDDDTRSGTLRDAWQERHRARVPLSWLQCANDREIRHG